MGQVLQEAGGQPSEVVPAREHAVSGPHQRTAERAGAEQLLPQQRRAGRSVAPSSLYVSAKYAGISHRLNLSQLPISPLIH